MPRFFCDIIDGNNIILNEEDNKHIIKSLRMKVGEELIVCDKNKNDYICSIKDIRDNNVFFNVLKKVKNIAEPSINTHLYMAFSKGDKMDFIIQKATELGVTEITPIYTKFITSKPDYKQAIKKISRYQKICLEASKQSGRGIIPIIHNPITFKECIYNCKSCDLSIIMYEKSGAKIKNVINDTHKNISVIIGSEGGFCSSEIEFSQNNGTVAVNLGNRILRCETAPIVTLSILMELSNNF